MRILSDSPATDPRAPDRPRAGSDPGRPPGPGGEPAVASGTERLQSWLGALADATRTRLLLVLSRHELSVNELVAALQLPQPTVSRHLRVLATDGWLSLRADGTSRYYRLNRDLHAAQRRLWEAVRDEVARGAEAEQDEARAVQAIELRRTALEQMFASWTLGWDQQRARMFGARIELRAFPALLDAEWTVADLGSGTGLVAEALAPHVARVIAVDESSHHLKEARRRLREYANVDVRAGSLEALPIESGSVDAAIIALALHYLPEPRVALSEAARVLRPGGKVLILDMMAHGREEYRLKRGHVWQGFERRQIEEWLQDAGLEHARYHELALDREAEGPPLFTASATKPKGKRETDRSAR